MVKMVWLLHFVKTVLKFGKKWNVGVEAGEGCSDFVDVGRLVFLLLRRAVQFLKEKRRLRGCVVLSGLLCCEKQV